MAPCNRLLMFAAVIAVACGALAGAGGANPFLTLFPSLGGSGKATSFSGAYLAARYAQNKGDWQTAYRFVRRAADAAPGQADFARRLLILSMGSGEYNDAIILAETLAEKESSEAGLAPLYLLLRAAASGSWRQSDAYLDRLKESPVAKFLIPSLSAWLAAGQGRYEGDLLAADNRPPVDRLMVATFLGHFNIVAQDVARGDIMKALSDAEKERIADWLYQKGQRSTALVLYDAVLAGNAAQPNLAEKRDRISKGWNVPQSWVKPLPASAANGIGYSLLDMAALLHAEGTDDSARLFANMALYMNAELDDAHLILGSIALRAGQNAHAVYQLRRIGPNNTAYAIVQQQLADLFIQQGHRDEALAILDRLARIPSHKVEALIQKGDLFRNEALYPDALKAYAEAAALLEEPLPEKYWYLHYLKGIALERTGQWKEAQVQLKKALEHRPNEPFVLNYLGYGWLEQGGDTGQALSLLEKAVRLKPDSGAIVDSYGWALYLKGDYQGAAVALERAAELLPDDATVNDHLGDVYWQLGRIKEARYQWQRALSASEERDQILSIHDKLAGGVQEKKAPFSLETLREAISLPAWWNWW